MSVWKSLGFGLVLATALAATPASAQIFSGDTTGEPVFHRPTQNSGNPPVSLSGVGTAVHYDVIPFTVTLNGTYAFSLTSSFDNYLGLYSGGFDPNAPLTNALIYNDDANGFNAAFSYGLLTGTSYFAVVTGFANGDFGAYQLSISGQAPVVGGAVPEPATWAMMLIGFGAVGFAMRKTRRKVAFA